MALRIEAVCLAACLVTACGESEATILSVDVEGRPDAVMRVDGWSRWWPAMALAGLPPGEHTVTVSFGEKTFIRKLSLEEGARETISIVATADDVADLERIRDGWRERLVEARYGSDEERAALADDLFAWENESFVDVVLDDIEASHDQWIIPTLVDALTGHRHSYWSRAVDALWLNFPKQASIITEEKIDGLNEWTAHELAMRASWAGHSTDRTMRVLDADCAKQTDMVWGLYWLHGLRTDAGTVMDLAYACPNYPGAKSPLLPGDSILSIDGVRLDGRFVLEAFRAKDRFTVRVARGGVALDFELSR